MSTKTPADVNNVLGAVADPQTYHLKDYEARYASFRWEDIYEEFDWSKTGKVNMAHEAIDRHLTRGRRNKLALMRSGSSIVLTKASADRAPIPGTVISNRQVGSAGITGYYRPSLLRP